MFYIFTLHLIFMLEKTDFFLITLPYVVQFYILLVHFSCISLSLVQESKDHWDCRRKSTFQHWHIASQRFFWVKFFYFNWKKFVPCIHIQWSWCMSDNAFISTMIVKFPSFFISFLLGSRSEEDSIKSFQPQFLSGSQNKVML